MRYVRKLKDLYLYSGDIIYTIQYCVLKIKVQIKIQIKIKKIEMWIYGNCEQPKAHTDTVCRNN